MSENTIIFSCGFCNHTGAANEFMVAGHPIPLECVDRAACERRQKRDLILIEIQEMARKPRVHPVDKFSFSAIALSCFFLGCVITLGVNYLWLGV